MNLDRSFIVITIAVAIASVAITAYHRIAARRAAAHVPNAQTAETPRSTYSEGRLIYIRPLGFVIWAAIIAYVSSPSSMRWSMIDVPDYVRWIGAGVSVLSLVLVTWTLRSLGINLSSGVVPLPHHHLVTSGPYRFVRHPWYSVLLLLLLGMTLMWASWVLAVMIAVRATYYFLRVPIEERALAERFGDSYRKWAERTPRFIPVPW